MEQPAGRSDSGFQALLRLLDGRLGQPALCLDLLFELFVERLRTASSSLNN